MKTINLKWVVLGLILMVTMIFTLVYAQTTTWAINKNVKMGEIEYCGTIPNGSNNIDVQRLHKIYDWQTGYIIYIVSTERGSDGRAASATISVVPMQKKW